MSGATSGPCEWPQCLQMAKNKIHSGIFSEEETETENKILVLLSVSEKSGGVWDSGPPCSPRPFVMGSAGGPSKRPPTRGPVGF